MVDVNIGSVLDFADPGRKVVDIDGVEIGVFRLGENFYAWENSCPHLDGPVCQGLMLPLTTEAADSSGKGLGRVFSATHMNVVCPWHGMEFDIRSGRHPTDQRFRLRKAMVRVENGAVIVTAPEHRRRESA